MESPESRPAAAKLIDQVVKEHRIQAQQDALTGEFRAGLSLCMQIYNALIKAGFMVEGWNNG